MVGAGGLGREMLDVIEAMIEAGHALEFLGFADDGDVDEERLARRGAALLGPVSAVSTLGAAYAIGIGDGAARQRIDEALSAAGCEAATLMHPMATVGGDCRIGAGCLLAAGSRVTTNITLGRHVQLHVNTTVGHDTTLGDFVTVLPGATVSGGVELGLGATVGTGANILPGVVVGDGAVVGAGAVVVDDVAAGITVVGVPARPLT